MDARTLGTRQILPYHLKKQRKKAEQENTHVAPVLPERAPSKRPRSTAAIEPTRVPFQERINKLAWNDY